MEVEEAARLDASTTSSKPRREKFWVGHALICAGIYLLVRHIPLSIALDNIGNAINGGLPAREVRPDLPLLQKQLYTSGLCFILYGTVILVTSAIRGSKSA
jgi:hypothetical protein